MARLVGVFASSHAPLIIRGWKDVKPANQRELTRSPAEPWMKDCPFKKIAGHPKLANHILQTALERDFEPSVSHHLTLDHGFCIPLWKGGLDPLPPIVPIIFNDLEPPYPSVRRCLHWGTMLAEAVRSYPEDIRVAVPATAGLSHSLAEPTMRPA